MPFKFINWYNHLQIRSKILWGVGFLMLLGTLVLMAFYVALSITDSALERVVKQEQPTSAAAYEMEVNLVRSSLEVMNFMRTGDVSHQNFALKHKNEFDYFLAQYNSVASNEEEKTFALQVSSLHDYFWRVGSDLMGRRAAQELSFTISLERIEEASDLIDETLAELGNKRSNNVRSKLLLEMKSSLATMGKDMGAFLRLGRDSVSDGLSEEAEQFLVYLLNYQALLKSEQEKIDNNNLAVLVDITLEAIKNTITIHKDAGRDLASFVQVRKQLDTLLSTSMLPVAKQDLEDAMLSAESISDRVKSAAGLTIPLIMLFSLLVVYGLTVSVTQPAEQLVAGAAAIGSGDLDYRIPDLGEDELGQMAKQFNVMAKRLETTTVSRDSLEASEAALRISEQRYARAVGGTNDGLFDWDIQTNSVYFSARWKSMLGYESHEIDDKPESYLHLVHIDDVDQLTQKIALYQMRPGEYLVNEHRVLHKDGKYRWVLFRALASDELGHGKTTRLSGSQSDIQAQKLAEQQLVHDAMHDKLTGLPNRHLLLERLQHFLDTPSRRQQELCGLLFLDLDGFKTVNDTRGHPAGDDLLVALASRLKNYLSPNDTLARFGGDEFVILLEDADNIAKIEEFADSIQKALYLPFATGLGESFVSASIGITLSSEKYVTATEMLRDADIAMYRAKAEGKKRYVIFDDTMHGMVMQQAELANDLRHALERKEFMIHYQPVIDLQNSRKLVGFEALLRWNHPQNGLIHPDDFIPLLEESGLIIAVGEWLIETVCRTVKAWHGTNYTPWVAVNVSAVQLRESGLFQVVKRALGVSGLEPQYLTLEITETNVMQNELVARALLNEVKQLGIKLSMDDFGTGYSSLSYLKRFPWDYVKIDRSFVRDIAITDEGVAIIEAIVVMVHSLNFSVVAEGVENLEQLSILRKYNIDYVQGYLLARPAAAQRWAGLNSLSSKAFLKDASEPSAKALRLI